MIAGLHKRLVVARLFAFLGALRQPDAILLVHSAYDMGYALAFRLGVEYDVALAARLRVLVMSHSRQCLCCGFEL